MSTGLVWWCVDTAKFQELISLKKSPVVNDVTFRIILVLMMLNKYKCRLIDVETAFLEGELEEEIFMDVPAGYREVLNEDTAGECLRLERPL